MRYLSLFSGIGGFELGIQQAYEEHKRMAHNGKENLCLSGGQEAEYGTGVDIPLSERPDGCPVCRSCPQAIGFSEIDRYAVQIYKKHFDHPNYGDITKIVPSELPDFDLLCGGFPCQAFSIAGKRLGFADTRGTLFFDIARILKEKQPRLVFLENVKGLLSHDGGRTFTTIISTLDELGYDVQWQVLNSKDFGVPQNRERVFIVGHLRGTPRPQVFPFGTDDQTDSRVQGYVANTLTRRYEGGQAVGTYVGESKLDAQIAYTLKARADSGIDAKHPQTVIRVPEATKQGYAVAKEGDSINLTAPHSSTPRGRVGKGVAQTIDTGMQQFTLQDMKIRRLTPKECERLQGFPDGWTEGISDSQRYKCLGNAVTVNVIREIAKKLL